MSDRCRHNEWEVTALHDGTPRKWRSAYPPPPPGTKVLVADGDVPEAEPHHWTYVIVNVELFTGYCDRCEQTIVTPCVVVAKIPEDSARDEALWRAEYPRTGPMPEGSPE